MRMITLSFEKGILNHKNFNDKVLSDISNYEDYKNNVFDKSFNMYLENMFLKFSLSENNEESLKPKKRRL